jgi:CheY-like chemotaxis protein
MNCKLLVRVLRKLLPGHFEIVGAADGREAVKTWESLQDRVQIIFMDRHMPDVDGLRATRLIRAREGQRGETQGALFATGRQIVRLSDDVAVWEGGPIGVPILCASAALVDDALLNECQAAGMNGYTNKPFTTAGLRLAVQFYLGDDYGISAL